MRIQFNQCDVCHQKKEPEELKNDFSLRTKDESIVFNELCDKCTQKIKVALGTIEK